MSPFYPPELLENIQAQNDIVEVISGYLPLKRAGQNYKALCPFHEEKTPSFSVSPAKQIFHCFGCGVGGDVFSFLMRHENMTFPEAVEFLARRAHIELPSSNPRAASRRQKLLDVHELARDFYHWSLTRAEAGEPARQYLRSREIKKETITKFKLGYALPSWDSFLRRARKKGYSDEILLEAGLVIKKKGGEGCYDRFRKRLIVPVCDARGRVIAFGGRVLDNSQPKYINSPETPLFRKGKMLFGLDLAKDGIIRRDQVILGEGYFDVIRAHQAGIKNMVCSQGTAFTESQARILKRYSDKVVTAFDADPAGQTAALRGLAIFLRHNFEVRIALLPRGEDPDSLIRRSGPEGFSKLVGESIPLIDFKLEILCRENDLKTDHGKLAVTAGMLETIRQIENAVLRDSYIKKLARRLSVSEAAVREEYQKKKTSPPAVKASPPGPGREEKIAGRLLKLLIEDDKYMNLLIEELDPTYFSPGLRPLAEEMIELSRKGRLPLAKTLPSVLREQKLQSLLSRWLLQPEEGKPGLREIVDLVVYLKSNENKRRSRQLQQQISLASGQGEDLAPLQSEAGKLKRELQELPERLKEKYKV